MYWNGALSRFIFHLAHHFRTIFFLFPTSYSMKQFDHSLHSIQEKSLEKMAVLQRKIYNTVLFST